MALTKEEQQLVVSVAGRLDVENLTDSYRKAERALADTIEQNRKGTLVGAAYEAQLKSQTGSMVKLGQALEKAQAANRDYRQNLMALSYVANDFLSVQGSMAQRLNAIANNLPMLLAGFGMLGPVLSGLAPAVGILISNWDKLLEFFGKLDPIKAAGTELDKLRNRVKELESNPVKLAVDLVELDNAKRRIDEITAGMQAWEKFKQSTTEPMKESGSRVSKVMSDAEGASKGELSEKLRRTRFNDLADNDPGLQGMQADVDRLQKEIEDLDTGKTKSLYPIQEMDKRQAEIDRLVQAGAVRLESLKKTAEQQIGSIVKGAGEGREKEQAELIKLLERNGRGDLAASIRGATPGAIRAQNEVRADLSDRLKNTVQGAAKNLRRTLDRRQRAGAVGEVNRQVVNRRQTKLTTEIPNAKDPSRPAEKLPITPEVKRQFEEGLASVLKETAEAMKAAALKGIAAGQLDKQTTHDLVGIANNSAAAASLPPDLREAITTAAAQQSMRGARAGLGPTPVTQPAPALKQPRGVDAKIQRSRERRAAQLRADQAETAAGKTADAAARKKGPTNVLLRRQARWKARKEPKPQQTAPQAAADAQAVDAAQQAAAGEQRAEQVGQAQGRQQAVNQAAAATGKPPEAVQSAMEFLKKQQAVIAAQQAELNQLRGLFTAGGRQAEAMRQRQQAEAAQWQSDGYSFLPPWQ